MKKRDESCVKSYVFSDYFALSKDMSILLKAIACIFILMGHYSRNVLGGGLPKCLSYYVTAYSAPVALTLFMFCSGYGITKISEKKHITLLGWFKRCMKVYLPLVFVCVIAMVFGLARHNGPLWQYCVGWLDEWYVWCIIYFYSIFYLSAWLSNCYHLNLTIVLAVGMLLYTFWSYYYHGYYQAHFYRYPCAFVLGHLVANRAFNRKSLSIIVGSIFLATIALDEWHYYKCYLLAIIMFFVAGFLDKYYAVKKGPLFILGGYSYFFYLCHERLGYPLLSSIGTQSCVFWIVITVILSFVTKSAFDYCYNKMPASFR